MTGAPLSVVEAARRIGMGKDAAYEAIKAGDFPLDVIKVGSRMRVPAPAVEFFCIFGRKPEPAELLEFVRSEVAS